MGLAADDGAVAWMHGEWRPEQEDGRRQVFGDERDAPLRSRGAAGGSSASRAGKSPKAPRSRKRRVLKWVSIGTAAVVLAVVAAGSYVYLHLTGNIKTAALLPSGVTQAPEIPNKFGQTALNILVMGSDTRDTAADCHLGGYCVSSPPHADVEMVVHLSADRSNATVMSIPRDSIVKLPACAQNQTNLINAALAYGPGCQVAAINQLTGLTIDHFVVVDMSGVVSLSNALGGVPVCVTNNIYDADSHLKLPKGTSVIQGVQALEWVRTRHAFINEVYREEAQHMFLSALVRKLKANASLSHITTLYSVADAATKTLTVDPALQGATDLLSLGQEIGKVPTNRISMMSVPTVDYTGPNMLNWREQLQFEEPEAQNMFDAIKADTPFSAGSASGTASTGGTVSKAPVTATTATSSVDKATVRVAVENGSAIAGRATAIKAALAGDGFTSTLITLGNATSTSTTKVYYPAGEAAAAAAVASALGIASSAVVQSSAHNVVAVVIGSDWTSGTTFGSATTTTTTTATAQSVATSPSNALATNASDTGACMYVARPEW